MENTTLLGRLGMFAHLLPSCDDYGVLIHLVGDTDENRQRYARHTYIQWYEVLAEKNPLRRLP